MFTYRNASDDNSNLNSLQLMTKNK